MRLSLVSLNAAASWRGLFVVAEAKTKVSLASPNGGVDQRKSPSLARVDCLASPATTPEQPD
jgi:hypothetical protein